MKNLWNNVKRKHVTDAIRKFEKLKPNYPKPRSTFLVFKGKRYPAKHIRGLAFAIANKRKIEKSQYSGGLETANFFRKLGFEVEYLRRSRKTPRKQLPEKSTSRKKLSLVEQKNALQKVLQKNALQKMLQKKFGIIETEKKFDWIKTPDPKKLPKEYRKIVKALILYRNRRPSLKPNYHLPCDIVLEKQKLIIEYDENQHFTQARRITLENYPENIKVYFDRDYWIEQCNKINAKDNDPLNRDETRAYYDAIRDIEAFKHGYRLVRIKHGDYDWRDKNAVEYLKKMIRNRNKKTHSSRVHIHRKPT